ncbi:MAG: hypothetical protein WBM05_04625 [Limnochordia bacterium]
MNLDERIREALRANSQWPGSPDELWQRISSQLQPKPKRSRQPLWLGTAAAAVLVLVFVFQAVWNPQPPPLPEAEEAVPMRMLTAVLPPSGPQLVQPGEVVELTLDAHLSSQGAPAPPRLEIWQEGDAEEVLVMERGLSGGELVETRLLTVQAPEEPGSYRLVVRGTVEEQGQLLEIYGEKSIVVAAAEGS